MYYRLMTIDLQLASKIIVNEKTKINEDASGFADNLLEFLLDNLGKMSTRNEKIPELFVKKIKKKHFDDEKEDEYEESQFKLNEDEEIPKEDIKKKK